MQNYRLFCAKCRQLIPGERRKKLGNSDQNGSPESGENPFDYCSENCMAGNPPKERTLEEARENQRAYYEKERRNRRSKLRHYSKTTKRDVLYCVYKHPNCTVYELSAFMSKEFGYEIKPITISRILKDAEKENIVEKRRTKEIGNRIRVTLNEKHPLAEKIKLRINIEDMNDSRYHDQLT